MKNELEFEALFQKSRGAAKRLQDISYQISKLEEKAKTFTGNKEEILIKFYLAMVFDIEDILKDLKDFKKEYENKRTK